LSKYREYYDVGIKQKEVLKLEELKKMYDDYFKTEERVPKLLSNVKLVEFVKESRENALIVYRALSGIFTHRYSGWIVSELKGEGDYQDYYSSGGEGAIANRKIYRLLKKSDLNVIDGNYTWNWILNKTIWRIRKKRMKRIVHLVCIIHRTKDNKKRIKVEKEFKRLLGKNDRYLNKSDKKKELMKNGKKN